MSRSLLLLLFSCPTFLFGQLTKNTLSNLESELALINEQKEFILSQIEDAKLEIWQEKLLSMGLPALQDDEQLHHHALFAFVYDDYHKQAKWVAHLISPDILSGTVTRTNDFRSDPLVLSGTAVEEDYFLRIEADDGTISYDGFGYDRGHLAPSADFRWSQKALSESYYYSNIAPQHPDLNRKTWASLEHLLRAYVYANQVPLYVVTGGVLESNLSKIERGIHKVSIPRAFWKVAIDVEKNKGIAFLIPNQLPQNPLEYYAISIDELEEILGIDFFASLDDTLENEVESHFDFKKWQPESALGDALPLPFDVLPKRHYNTIVGAKQAGTGTEVYVCGTVVRGRTSRKGNVILNLDKAWPNELFNIFISKKNLINFPNQPEKDYQNTILCVLGEVSKIGNTPTIFATTSTQFKLLEGVSN